MDCCLPSETTATSTARSSCQARLQCRPHFFGGTVQRPRLQERAQHINIWCYVRKLLWTERSKQFWQLICAFRVYFRAETQSEIFVYSGNGQPLCDSTHTLPRSLFHACVYSLPQASAWYVAHMSCHTPQPTSRSAWALDFGPRAKFESAKATDSSCW